MTGRHTGKGVAETPSGQAGLAAPLGSEATTANAHVCAVVFCLQMSARMPLLVTGAPIPPIPLPWGESPGPSPWILLTPGTHALAAHVPPTPAPKRSLSLL